MSGRRVVVTGVGTVSPLGSGVATTWEAAVAGRSGVAPITRFDTQGHTTTIAAEVTDFDPLTIVDKREARRSDRFTLLALASAVEACAQAGWSEGLPHPGQRVGVIVGSGIGGLSTLEAQLKTLSERGPSKLSPYCIPALMGNAAAGSIAMRLGARGPNMSTVSACATGSHAVGEAARLIRDGIVDAAVCGGSEATVTPLAVGSFAAMGALSARNDEPSRASRPFDTGRDGFVLGEGAAILVLEEASAAAARGVPALAELAGYGASGDAFHLTQPDPEGTGAIDAMRAAMADAGVEPGDIGYINAHGTSTPYNDKIEALAINKVFGPGGPAVSSTKSVTGHLLGAAGAIEAVFCVEALRNGVLPPTMNLDDPDPECDLDHVANAAREVQVEYALSNSFGFGGHNACLLFRRTSA